MQIITPEQRQKEGSDALRAFFKEVMMERGMAAGEADKVAALMAGIRPEVPA